MISPHQSTSLTASPEGEAIITPLQQFKPSPLGEGGCEERADG